MHQVTMHQGHIGVAATKATWWACSCGTVGPPRGALALATLDARLHVEGGEITMPIKMRKTLEARERARDEEKAAIASITETIKEQGA